LESRKKRGCLGIHAAPATSASLFLVERHCDSLHKKFSGVFMCDFVGWCVLLSAEWVDAIGSVIGGLGAAAAAWTSVMIARSIRQAEDKRRRAEAITLLRLITPEMTLLPAKLHRFLTDIEETRPWWDNSNSRGSSLVPQLLSTTLERLSEDAIPHASAAAHRLAVLDDINYASIAHDTASLVTFLSQIRDAAMAANNDLKHGAVDLEVTLEKLLNLIRYIRGLAAQLANEMQPTIGMSKTDYVEMFNR
jgi:hypothetical protein